MRRSHARPAVGLLAFAAALVSPSAWVENDTEPTLLTQVVHQEYATVAGLDPGTHMVSVREDGGRVSRVGPVRHNFDQIRLGDRVNVTFYAATAVQSLPNPSADASARVQSQDYTAPQGIRPATASGQTVHSPVTVVAVDPVKESVTVQHADGRRQTIQSDVQPGQELIRRLHPGESIELIQTRSVSVRVSDVRSR